MPAGNMGDRPSRQACMHGAVVQVQHVVQQVDKQMTHQQAPGLESLLCTNDCAGSIVATHSQITKQKTALRTAARNTWPQMSSNTVFTYQHACLELLLWLRLHECTPSGALADLAAKLQAACMCVNQWVPKYICTECLRTSPVLVQTASLLAPT